MVTKLLSVCDSTRWMWNSQNLKMLNHGHKAQCLYLASNVWLLATIQNYQKQSLQVISHGRVLPVVCLVNPSQGMKVVDELLCQAHRQNLFFKRRHFRHLTVLRSTLWTDIIPCSSCAIISHHQANKINSQAKSPGTKFLIFLTLTSPVIKHSPVISTIILM